MSAGTIATIAKMLEMLPDSEQERVADHVREYIEDLRDEIHWDTQFSASQGNLSEFAKQARQEIKKGLSKPLDVNEL